MNSILSAIGTHGRSTEWLTSFVLLAIAATMALPGNSMLMPGLNVLGSLGLEEASVAVPLALISTARMTALYINGKWRRSPQLRMLGAFLGAATFGALGAAYLWPWVGGFGAPAPGAGTYFVLACFDMLAAHRSGADVGMASRAVAARS